MRIIVRVAEWCIVAIEVFAMYVAPIMLAVLFAGVPELRAVVFSAFGF